jgi:hypothetical protein
VTDLTIPCRGLSFALIRTYRSAHRSRGDAFGHGWSFTYAKRVERDGDQILYHDGKGRTYRLHREPRSHRYIAARELYAVLVIEEDKVELRHAVGLVLSFEKFDVGGRLLAIRDRNGNTLKFEHSNHALHVTDSFGRLVTFTYKGGRIVQLSDYGGRVWEYNYDQRMEQAKRPFGRESP